MGISESSLGTDGVRRRSYGPFMNGILMPRVGCKEKFPLFFEEVFHYFNVAIISITPILTDAFNIFLFGDFETHICFIASGWVIF